ncbi:MAG: beta-propeller domain-containing protein [Oscillospiraceae bacterium]|jgi:inhibitor of cysteine peptidase
MNTQSKRRSLASILLFFFLVGFCAACSNGGDTLSTPKETQSKEEVQLKPAESYDTIYKTLKTFTSIGKDARALADTANSGSSGQSIKKEAAAEDSSSDLSASYSETNVQVQGIDEGDIVKTDGSYIYVLKNTALFIFSADGSNTTLLSETAVGQEWQESDAEDGSYSYSYDTPYALYLSGDRLVVLSNYGDYSYNDNDAIDDVLNRDTVRVRTFDISDPTAPNLLETSGQDGNYFDSRLSDGILYVASSYTVYTEPEEDTPTTYVPSLYRNSERSAIACDHIYLPPDVQCDNYTVLVSYDLKTGTQISDTAVMDGSSALYMNQDNLYLFHTVYQETASDPYQKDQYSVVDYTATSITDIYRFSISNGAFTLAATGSIDGYLVNQFAADEYDGVLRVVTTVDVSNYSIYSDKAHEWDNYEWQDPQSSNALYTLDSDLKPIGSITDLANEESVYSVRFADEIAYFVTFYQTDPLFAVDVSDPAAPTMLDSLKITGFSEYLHPYSEGLLFGLGMEADEETGETESMKLTMFDISDPTAVSVQNTTQIDADWSIALNNHKAILISAEQNLIAFPTDSGYLIYGYSATEGFSLQAEIAFDSDYWYSCYDARGLYIDDTVYIVGDDALFVLSMTDFTTIAQLSYNN